MYPNGVIYDGGAKSHGEVQVQASLATRLFYGLVQGIGAGIIGFVVISLLFTFGPLVKEETMYSLGLKTKVSENGFGNLVSGVSAESEAKVRAEAASLGLDSYFSVYIPKIDAKERIIANVDTANKADYEDALLKGVGHARGTYFPGQGRNIFLFAHSTDSSVNFARYNAVFYLLPKLETGDKIIIYFADKKYQYQVTDKITTSAKDTKWVLNPPVDGETLILQTCYPPGTTWQRMLILAKPVDN